MTTEPMFCAACGAPIARKPGGLWYHTGSQVPHPATPRATAEETWQAAQARLSALEARLSAQRPLVEAALAWLPEHAEYTGGCETCERLVSAARAYRAARGDQS